jgi:hypothetical protein
MGFARRTLASVVSFAALGGTLLAQGGPPMLTDDPGTPGNKNWEINIASTLFFSHSEKEIEAPLLDINFGLGNRIQLKYEVPYTFDSDEGRPYRPFLGNSLMGVKWRFFQQKDEKGWRISTYPQLEVNNPDQSHTNGLVDRGPRFLLPIEATKIVGPLEMNFEGGYWFSNHQSNERILGLAVGHEFNRRFEGVAEIYDDVLFGGNSRSTTFDVGGRYEFHKGLLFLFMAGHSVGVGGQEPTYIAYVGLQIQVTHAPRAKRSGPNLGPGFGPDKH